MQSLPDRPCRPGGILLVGINPSTISAAKGHYYQGSNGKRLWKRLASLGLLSGVTKGLEDDAFVAAGNGLTNLVKRPTSRAAQLN
jgi:double-stranded uracil-DNA glycosylase